jgi:hypothetical protein
MSKNTRKGSGINEKTVSTDEKQRLEENTINIWVTLDEKKFLNKIVY